MWSAALQLESMTKGKRMNIELDNAGVAVSVATAILDLVIALPDGSSYDVLLNRDHPEWESHYEIRGFAPDGGKYQAIVRVADDDKGEILERKL